MNAKKSNDIMSDSNILNIKFFEKLDKILYNLQS